MTEVEVLRMQVENLKTELDDALVALRERLLWKAEAMAARSFFAAQDGVLDITLDGVTALTNRALAAEAERDALREQVGKLALLLDRQMGTPCEQIRHQQVVDGIRAVIEDLIVEAKDNIHSDDWQQGVRYACAEVLGCLD